MGCSELNRNRVKDSGWRVKVEEAETGQSLLTVGGNAFVSFVVAEIAAAGRRSSWSSRRRGTRGGGRGGRRRCQ